LDKPFTYGDVVTVNGYTGTVEKVGFRSTRIRTFDKSIVTVPNKNMVNAELDNLGVRPIRRVKFNIGLTYGTTIDQMKTIVAQLEEMINAHPKTTNGDARVRFQEFGGSSLDVLVIYFVDSPNWDLLIDTRQEINFSIIEIIQTNGCDFAFPTTSVYLEK
jgi:MscS family membrane protein